MREDAVTLRDTAGAGAAWLYASAMARPATALARCGRARLLVGRINSIVRDSRLARRPGKRPLLHPN
jgi:hypothetical protein